MKFRSVCLSILVALFPWVTAAQIVTGFEPPTYFSGEINGQDNWTTSANTATARVLTASEIANELTNAGLTPGVTVHGGLQALFVSGAGPSNATIRVITGLEAQTKVLLDVWARPLAAGTTGAPIGNIFLTMEDAAGTRAAAFRFGSAPSIDYGTNIPSVWQASGLSWDTDAWYRLTMSLDYAEKTYDFFVNGAKLNQSPIPFYNANSANLSQIRIFRGQNQAGMIVDDLVVALPEPGAVICLLLGASPILLQRRRPQNAPDPLN